ncbi:MAG: 2,3-bisphosphoglycerate-independent phosphoglycerate mutase [Candidatus Dojkabacteria bacterium]
MPQYTKQLPMTIKQKVLLIILDGLGTAPKNKGNAVVLADPKNLSSFWNIFPKTYLLASGESVGLPKNIKGNSEVGHLNIGAGRTVSQNLPRINNAIEKGMIYKNTTLREAYIHAQKFGGNIHLVGLLSDGAVHSHIDHFKAIVDYFSKNNFPNNLFIHAITDGRDSPFNKSLEYLTEMDKYCLDRGIGQIGTIIGRFYAMDRGLKWDRTQRAYYLLEQNFGEKFSTYQQAIESQYARGLTDEFIEPIVINESKVQQNDVVIMVNYRPDRAMQLAEAFISPDFTGFSRKTIPNLFFASMVEYKKGFPQKVLFQRQYLNLTLGKIIESSGGRQLRIAETEKFPHVTYFFNGGSAITYSNEDRILIPSPRVATYDLKPEMSALEVTYALQKRISAQIYDFILVNFANMDMVGHTGNLEAGIKAVQVVDTCVKELVRSFTSYGGAVIITADHGNVEEMINLETNEIDTEHSLNPVPFILAGTQVPPKTLPYGALKDIAPTILEIMGIPKPSEITGNSLIRSI